MIDAPAVARHNYWEDLVQQISSRVVLVPQPDEVHSYLDQHRDLTELVGELCARARAEFGESAELSLEIYHDPEIQDRYLMLIVRLATYPDKIMDRIRGVGPANDDDAYQKSGQILVTTDFRSPGWKHGISLGRVS